MKTAEKINLYSQLIQHIDYDNREGGKYAYIQYMSYVREILALLVTVHGLDVEIAYLKQTSAKCNEYLCHTTRLLIGINPVMHTVADTMQRMCRRSILRTQRDSRVGQFRMMRQQFPESLKIHLFN